MIFDKSTGKKYIRTTEQDEICNNCGLKAHSFTNCPEKKETKVNPNVKEQDIQCKNCKKYGHHYDKCKSNEQDDSVLMNM